MDPLAGNVSKLIDVWRTSWKWKAQKGIDTLCHQASILLKLTCTGIVIKFLHMAADCGLQHLNSGMDL